MTQAKRCIAVAVLNLKRGYFKLSYSHIAPFKKGARFIF
jgi:hypothetical protein